MARKSRKNMMPLEATALPDKEKKVLFKAGLYARLSHETEENIERGTIETQMELMKNYVKDHEDIVIEEEYYDASFTGTNFERPDFKRMLEDAKTGRINCIIVKDLSRLGRNYVEMGNYIERVFPFLNVRFIGVLLEIQEGWSFVNRIKEFQYRIFGWIIEIPLINLKRQLDILQKKIMT